MKVFRTYKRDANHKALSADFERLGWKVHHTNGDWDATICKRDVVRLIEYKDPKSPNLKRKNRGDKLKADGWPIIRVLTQDDVIKVNEGA